ncbi:hypothetical protein FWF48_03400 [Candidatus Saccharibacteria bacterium]|nr:hypothetical protein [Candidatus Saccharibacteria bacterium]
MFELKPDGSYLRGLRARHQQAVREVVDMSPQSLTKLLSLSSALTGEVYKEEESKIKKHGAKMMELAGQIENLAKG